MCIEKIYDSMQDSLAIACMCIALFFFRFRWLPMHNDEAICLQSIHLYAFFFSMCVFSTIFCGSMSNLLKKNAQQQPQQKQVSCTLASLNVNTKMIHIHKTVNSSRSGAFSYDESPFQLVCSKSNSNTNDEYNKNNNNMGSVTWLLFEFECKLKNSIRKESLNCG